MRPNSTFLIGHIGTATTSQITCTFDTRGYSFARIIVAPTGSTVVGLSTTNANNILEESDASGSGFTAIAAAGAGTAYTPSSATAATSLARLIYEVDLRGRKRYLKPTFSAHATGTFVVFAELSLPADGVTSAADNGSAFIAQV